MIETYLKDEIRNRGISIRTAAREMGVAHTTIRRALQGNDVDLSTVTAISKWLKVDVVNLLSVSSNPTIRNQLCLSLERNPWLFAIFSELANDSDLLIERDLEDLLEYARFILTKRKSAV